MKLYRLQTNDNYQPYLKSYANIDNIDCGIEDVIYNLCDNQDLWDSAIEYQYIIALNDRSDLLGAMNVSIGNSSEMELYLENIFRFLLLIGATRFLTMHNHPAGKCEKSSGDINSDEIIENQAKLFHIEYLDSIIVCKTGYKIMNLNKVVERSNNDY